MRLSRTLPIAASALLAFAGMALGQGTTIAAGGGAGQPTTPAPEAVEPLVTVNFPGGSVDAYVRVLRESCKEPVNVVVSKAAAGIELAPVQLRDATLDAAVEAIQAAAGASNADGSWFISSASKVRAPGSARVFLVDYRSRAASMKPAATGVPASDDDLSRIEVISIRQITTPQPGEPAGFTLVERPEVVLSAVEAALAMGDRDGASKPEVRYHQDSGLLIVRAGPSQMRAIQQAVSEISADVKRRRDAARIVGGLSDEDLADMRAEVEKAQVMRAQHAARLDAARAQLKNAEELFAQGAVASAEIARVRTEAASNEAAVRMSEIEMKRAEERLAAAMARQRRAAASSAARAQWEVLPAAVEPANAPGLLALLSALREGAGVQVDYAADQARIVIEGPGERVESVSRILDVYLAQTRLAKPRSGTPERAGGGR